MHVKYEGPRDKNVSSHRGGLREVGDFGGHLYSMGGCSARREIRISNCSILE
jgi:hypothetical protein